MWVGVRVSILRYVELLPFSFLLGLAFVFKILDKTFNMRGILYTIAVLCIIGWLIGVFVYSVTGLIHILIVLAIISLILAIIRRGSV